MSAASLGTRREPEVLTVVLLALKGKGENAVEGILLDWRAALEVDVTVVGARAAHPVNEPV